jgi:hypothetical protein
MARDRVAEITSAKKRGRGSLAILAHFVLLELQGVGNQKPDASGHYRVPDKLWAALLVVRAVTALEVFTREWTARLIDSGTPFAENAADIDAVKKGKPFDFALSMAIQGKQLSVGELIAHDIPINSLSDILRVLTQIIGEDVVPLLKFAYDRFAVEVEGKTQVPIISDFGKLHTDLTRLRTPSRNQYQAEE